MAKSTSRSHGPVTLAMTVLGVGVVAALVIGLIYGLLIGDVPRGLGQGGAVVMIIAAVAGVAIIFRADARRRQTGR